VSTAVDLVSDTFVEFCASGLWPGVGKGLALAMREAGLTGPAAVNAQNLVKLPKVTAKRADRLLTSWIGVGQLYELAELLVPQDIPVRWAARLTDQLGDDAVGELRRNPWRLLVLPDATVAQADQLARALEPGVRRDDVRRGRALIGWTLARFARDGHTAAPVAVVSEALRPFGIDAPGAAAALAAAGEAGDVAGVLDPTGNREPWVAPSALCQAESDIADGIRRLAANAKALAGDRAVRGVAGDLDEVQAGAVAHAAAHGVSLLTGGPGTGKSRTVSAIVALCRKVEVTVALAAPTGRAAKRLEELAGHPATTVHRLLGARRAGAVEDNGSVFDHDALHPLDVGLVVVDEASMLDVELAAALINAIPDGAHLVVVGDPAQLPSIGPGRVLGDLIDADAVPVTELRTLYRQSEGGSIARLATAVRGGTLPPVDDPTREVVVVPSPGSEPAAQRVVQLVTDSIPRVFGLSGDQVQVVTPVHRGPAGTQGLNRLLKARLNPGTGTVRGFDVGDRVVATANHADAEPFGYANGEVGTVTAAGDNSVTVAFPGGEAEIAGKALNDLLHGWAITVHRAQGSEWEAVVAVLPPEAGQMLSRPLIYTAITRARRHLSVVHAAGPAVARAVRQVGARPRRTLLRALLVRGAVAQTTGGA